jgi:dolichol-phosphate mannosyltransferase
MSTSNSSGGGPLLSIVVPTRNEAGNVEPLVERLRSVVASIPSEIIFIDDSTDETPRVLERLAASGQGNLEFNVVLRGAGQHTGLGSAVAEGLKMARGNAMVVMDADLQHPPELLRAMVAVADKRDLDVVVASRYVKGGSADGLEGPARRLVSSLSRRLVQLIFREANKTSDPLSGYFLCRRSAVEGLEFRPIGFKVLLEILVCATDARVGDVPLRFGARHSGLSNASVAQGWAFARHLISLLVQVPGSARLWKYAVVGGSGLAIYIATLAIEQRARLTPFLSWSIAFGLSLAFNWQLNRIFTFADVASPFTPGRSRPLYLPAALTGGLINLIVFASLLGRMPLLVAGFFGAVAAMAFNYAFHRRLLRRPPYRKHVGAQVETAILARVERLIDGTLTLLPPGLDEDQLSHHFEGRFPTELVRASDERKPVLVALAPSHVPQARHDIGLSAWMAVPVLEGRRYIGLLVAHRQGRQYSEEELHACMHALRSTARDTVPILGASLAADFETAEA